MSKKIDRTGEIYRYSDGRVMKIIRYRNAADIDVMFNDGKTVSNVRYQHFKVGNISGKRRHNKGE